MDAAKSRPSSFEKGMKTVDCCVRHSMLKSRTHLSSLYRQLFVMMLCTVVLYFALYNWYTVSSERPSTITTINRLPVDASRKQQSIKPLEIVDKTISVHDDPNIDVKKLVGYVLEVIKQERMKNEKTPAAFIRNSNDSKLDINQLFGSIGVLSKDLHEMKVTLQRFIRSDKGNGSIWNTKLDENTNVLITNKTKRQTSLLTLFSTLTNIKDTTHNTLQNWASLKPAVHPVLFTDDSVLAKEAEQFGWTVLHISKKAINKLPVLKYMYMDVVKRIDSEFYCYANSDVLFDGGLLKTLVSLMFTFNDEISSIPMLISGIRWNVINVSQHEITPRRNINNLVVDRGNIFLTSAEDYFITNVIYPWHDIPEVVVGSVAYDNWLVLNAREKKHLTIDASKTISVIHQSLDGHHYRSHLRDTANYNANLLKDTFKINIPYHKGFLNCIETFTDVVNDTFVVRKRKVETYCN